MERTSIILDVICAVILIVFISNGRKKGGVKSVIELLSFAVTVVLVMLFKDTVTKFVLNLDVVSNWANSLTEYFKGPFPFLTDMIMPPEQMASSLISVIINLLSFVVTFIIVKFVLKVVLGIADVITSLPFISSANRLIGSVIGCAKGLVVIWIIMTVMLIFTATEFYNLYSSALADSYLAKFLFNNNMLFSLFK